MAVFPPEGGRLVIKSTKMWDHGRLGTGKGHNRLVRGFPGCFGLSACGTSRCKLSDNLGKSGPPEALLHPEACSGNSWAAGETGGVAPLKNSGSQIVWNKQTVTGASRWFWGILQGGENFSLCQVRLWLYGQEVVK